MATIGKDASSGEGMTFYTVTLEYFKFLLPDEHFMLARTFLQQVYEFLAQHPNASRTNMSDHEVA